MAASRLHDIAYEADGKALTLDELAAFVQDAMRTGASGSEVPKVRINFGGTVRRIELSVASVQVKDSAPSTT